jgi:hypothetical protein
MTEMHGMHYVITLQFEARNGIQQVAYETGVIFPDPGQTRGDLFRRVFKGAAARLGDGANPVPLFFSLEPNALKGMWHTPSGAAGRTP